MAASVRCVPDENSTAERRSTPARPPLPKRDIPRVDVRMSPEERRRRLNEALALIVEQDAEALAELAK